MSQTTNIPSPRPRKPAVFLLGPIVVAVALLLAGCGDDENDADSDGSAVVSTTNQLTDGATTIPDLPVNDDPAAVACTGPPQGTFDATAVVGDPIGVAKGAAAAEGCQIRVAVRNGESLALTQDFRPDRVNVAIENGDVTEIVNLG